MAGKLLSLYRPPSHVEAGEQAKVYLDEVVSAFVEMRPTEAEWDHVWREFARTWPKPYWPLPSELPGLLRTFRARQAATARAGNLVTYQAEDETPVPVDLKAEEQAGNLASWMATDRDRFTSAIGRACAALGVALRKRFDEQGRERRRTE